MTGSRQNEAGKSVRLAAREDLTEISRLEENSFSVPWSETLLSQCLDSRFDRVWVLEECGRESEENGQTKADEFLQGETEKKIAGYCNLRVIAGEGELMRIAVDPGRRGRGYARILMDTLVASAREQGAEAVTLEVRSSNKTAINLYQSFGFTKEAVRKSYYTAPVEDALIMRLSLA